MFVINNVITADLKLFKKFRKLNLMYNTFMYNVHYTSGVVVYLHGIQPPSPREQLGLVGP